MAISSSPNQVRGVPVADWQAPPSAAFDANSPRPTSSGMRTFKRVVWNLLPPLTFAGMVALWWAAVELFKIPAYLLPCPGPVFSRLIRSR
jgi:NitT/TauT family transport system permease protein